MAIVVIFSRKKKLREVIKDNIIEEHKKIVTSLIYTGKHAKLHRNCSSLYSD